MLIFDNKFLLLRNNYIIPIINYTCNLESIYKHDFKKSISQKIIRANCLTNNKFELEIEGYSFYNSLVTDIELFYTKTLLQYADIINSPKMSSHWYTVSIYYLNFFSITTLFRLTQRGFVYLDGELSKQISTLISQITHQPIQLNDGNYLFFVRNNVNNGNALIELVRKDDVHKNSWDYLKEFFLDDLSYCKNDELAVLKTLRKMSNENNSNFPSTIRNKVNYNAQYGLHSINNNFHKSNIILDSEELGKRILKYSYNTDFGNMVYLSSLFGNYFFALTLKLYNEYRERQIKISDFEKLRMSYFKKHKLDFPQI